MFYRAKILSYNAQKRTANVHIIGLTDGAEDGLVATFAYPVGDDDRDTERQIVTGNDCYIFFESGDYARPVIAFYASHGEGALTDIRRIQQANIELLAQSNIDLFAQSKTTIDAPTIHLKGNVVIDGDVTHTGNTTQTGDSTLTGSLAHTGNSTHTGNTVTNGAVTVNGTITATGTITSSVDVIGGGKSLLLHIHGGVLNGGGSTTPPIA